MASVHMIPETLLKMFPEAECVDCMKTLKMRLTMKSGRCGEAILFIVLNVLGVRGLAQMNSILLVEKT